VSAIGSSRTSVERRPLESATERSECDVSSSKTTVRALKLPCSAVAICGSVPRLDALTLAEAVRITRASSLVFASTRRDSSCGRTARPTIARAPATVTKRTSPSLTLSRVSPGRALM
jgi:hypothetical protein